MREDRGPGEPDEAGDKGLRSRRAAGDVDRDGDQLVDPLRHGGRIPVGTSRVRAGSERHSQLGILECSPGADDSGCQSISHGSGDEQDAHDAAVTSGVARHLRYEHSGSDRGTDLEGAASEADVEDCHSQFGVASHPVPALEGWKRVEGHGTRLLIAPGVSRHMAPPSQSLVGEEQNMYAPASAGPVVAESMEPPLRAEKVSS